MSHGSKMVLICKHNEEMEWLRIYSSDIMLLDDGDAPSYVKESVVLMVAISLRPADQPLWRRKKGSASAAAS
jgi:hypothetical protein